MKKVMLGVAVVAAGLLSSAVIAQEVTSANAVGIIKVEAARGAFTFLGTPFNKVGGSDTFTLAELLGTNVPPGTAAYIYTDQQRYVIASFSREDGWPNIQVSRGKGVFVMIPANYSNPTFTFSLVGEVPIENHDAKLDTGFTAITFAFPVETPVSATRLAVDAVAGDAIAEWTGTGWKFYSWSREDGWPISLTFKPGYAYFYRTNAERNWTEVRADYYVKP